MESRTFTMVKPSDFHTHVRQGEMLPRIVELTAKNFAYILVMPNTTPPKLTGTEAREYYDEIRQYSEETEVLVTIKITDKTDELVVKSAMEQGVKVGKLYFGITTNEAEGGRKIEAYYGAFRAMEKHGMILSVHGERSYRDDGSKILNLLREKEFVPLAAKMLRDFPRLRVVFEHITTVEMVHFVRGFYNTEPGRIAATITAHHLRDNIDAILGFDSGSGEGINPHNYCKPVPKTQEDVLALRFAATSELPCFFFGSDSAPHTTDTKECCCGKPGVFSAVTRIETLAEIFNDIGCLNKLEGFASIYGAKFYGLPIPKEQITLVQEEWSVPQENEGVTNYRFGQKIQWKVL